MKKKYYSYDTYKSNSSYEDFAKSLGTYTYDDETDSIEYNGYVDMNDYQDVINQILKQYNDNKEEAPEQKAIRLAKEKAEKRNNKIDQILGE
jgi:hypothetical protein